jgi:exo-beta-1,3-glucanase (GH17 family)/cellulose synthase/poly-beta-1,6-N-acetylglucosamine synthase-like glycosyltransferase
MRSLFRPSTILILGLLSLLNIGLWALANRPMEEKGWSGIIQGLSYSPYRSGQDPQKGDVASYADIDEDMRLLQDKTASVRTYSALDGNEQVPRIAAKYGLRVSAGAWIGDDHDRNEREIQSLIWIVNHNPNVNRALIGNEAVLRGEITPAELAEYLRRVKQKINVPVSTAEPWHVWLANPELARAADFIAVHILPYWEGQPLDKSIDFIQTKLSQLQKAYPKKQIVLTEVGWPSDGRIKKKAVPSLANQAVFLRKFLNFAQAHNADYYIMEAFDQPWKRHLEGSVGSYWGLFDDNRNWKFSFVGPVVPVPHWPFLAAASTVLALFPMGLFLMRARNMRAGGRVFYAGMIQIVATTLVWAAHVATDQYLTLGEIVTWLALGSGLGLLMAILLSEALELAEALWLRLNHRPDPQMPDSATPRPRVSVQIPICNEPPGLVIQSLEALSHLDYPNFEVLVVDNNTTDPQLWLPVKAYCEAQGPRFRFFHLDKCPGFKAGALNFALSKTDPTAEIIGVIDSDYAVNADWLKIFAPYFADPKIGFVQAPQDYRDWRDNAFKEMCYWEYAGFFHVGMVVRNERNAIIQHGTMTLVRAAALKDVGGWAEWCITEDAELGLRLFEKGHESLYLNKSFGQGVTPDTFAGYKSQRFRWAYGAVQILKHHWREFMPWSGSTLTTAQRYHFIAGWMPWFGDALYGLFTAFAVVWTFGLVTWPKHFDFPLTVFIASALGLFVFKTLKSFVLYGFRIKCSLLQNIGAAIAALSLTHTIGKAMLTGIFTADRPFLRTPKWENQPAVLRGLAMAWEETSLMVLLWVAAAIIIIANASESPEAWLWAAMLLGQSVPYSAALVTAMVNVMPQLRPRRAAASQPAPAESTAPSAPSQPEATQRPATAAS